MSFYQRRVVVFDASSDNSSTYTSSAQYAGDYDRLTVQLDVVNSTVTLQGSDDDGFGSSINTWSDLTAITSAGIFTVDPGTRWIRGQRSSADSQVVVQLQGRS